MLIKTGILGLQQWRINNDITSRSSNDMNQVHAIRDGLDTASYDLNQVLKDQGGQINLVVDLNLVHEPVINLVHCSMLRPYGLKEMRHKQMQEAIM